MLLECQVSVEGFKKVFVGMGERYTRREVYFRTEESYEVVRTC